jgi:hypothetical protein
MQKTLYALPGIAYQRAACNAFGRPGVAGYANYFGAAIQSATVKDRSPIEPEIIFYISIVGQSRKVFGKCSGGPFIELNHGEWSIVNGEYVTCLRVQH